MLLLAGLLVVPPSAQGTHRHKAVYLLDSGGRQCHCQWQHVRVFNRREPAEAQRRNYKF